MRKKSWQSAKRPQLLGFVVALLQASLLLKGKRNHACINFRIRLSCGWYYLPCSCFCYWKGILSMIQNKTARKLMYDWHSGQFSALYKAASSGLVEDINNLEYEINHIDYPKDKAKLMEWWKAKKVKLTSVLIINNFYIALPWG